MYATARPAGFRVTARRRVEVRPIGSAVAPSTPTLHTWRRSGPAPGRPRNCRTTSSDWPSDCQVPGSSQSGASARSTSRVPSSLSVHAQARHSRTALRDLHDEGDTPAVGRRGERSGEDDAVALRKRHEHTLGIGAGVDLDQPASDHARDYGVAASCPVEGRKPAPLWRPLLEGLEERARPGVQDKNAVAASGRQRRGRRRAGACRRVTTGASPQTPTVRAARARIRWSSPGAPASRHPGRRR